MAAPSEIGTCVTDEFDLISQYFAPLAGDAGLGLLDDAACFTVADGFDLIVSADMLVEGVHFAHTDNAEDIGFKAVSVNVSDLAAKGALPKYYLLTLALPPNVKPSWLQQLASGLAKAQATYGIELIGGDTTKTSGPVVVSITAHGLVTANRMIKRSGAQAGDDLYVSGTIGDAALGVKATQGEIKPHTDLLNRLNRPQARHIVGQRLVGLATSAADVSDGLLADIGHICKASGKAARLYEKQIPLSKIVLENIKENASLWPAIWSGGDDYEIIFTAPKKSEGKIIDVAKETGVALTKIGHISDGAGVELVDMSGKLRQVTSMGYQHF